MELLVGHRGHTHSGRARAALAHPWKGKSVLWLAERVGDRLSTDLRAPELEYMVPHAVSPATGQSPALLATIKAGVGTRAGLSQGGREGGC